MRKVTESIDYTNRDYEAYREMLLQKLKEKMPEYTDTSQSDAGIVILECLANGLDILSMYTDIIANDVLLPTTQDRRMACVLARNLGYTPYNQTSSITPQVFVLNQRKTNDFTVPKGTIVTTEVEEGQTPIKFETTEALTIKAGDLGDEKNEDGSYKYTVDVAQGTSVIDDLLGSSTGAPYQSFKMSFAKVLTDSIVLYVDEGDGAKEWKQVDSLLDTSINGNSKVYTVTIDDFDRCYIEFGNGLYGKIPSVYSNGITANYRIGGGESGNVQSNTITVLETGLASIDKTFNPVGSTTLAHDKETIDEIRCNAPASFKTRDRAVTLSDYEDLVRINNKGNLFAFKDTKAVRDSTNGMLVHLFYQLREGYSLTDELRQELFDFFSSRVMIGTELSLEEYEKYNLKLTANLMVDKDYVQSEVENDVRTYITGAFFDFGKFTFGDEFVKSDLEGEIKSTFAGVRSFRITSPTEDIVTTDKDYQIITLDTDHLVLNTTGGKA